MFEVGKSYRMTMWRDDRKEPQVQEYAPCVVREVNLPLIKIWDMAAGEMVINTASLSFISAREATSDQT